MDADYARPMASSEVSTGTVGPARGQPFRVEAPFTPAGDQPKAIEELADGTIKRLGSTRILRKTYKNNEKRLGIQ